MQATTTAQPTPTAAFEVARPTSDAVAVMRTVAGCLPLPATAVEALVGTAAGASRLWGDYVLTNPHADTAASDAVTARAAAGDLTAITRTGDTDLLAWLVEDDPDGLVRAAVAQNPSCPTEILTALLDDEQPWVRIEALTNVATPTAAVAAALDVAPLSEQMPRAGLSLEEWCTHIALATSLLVRTHPDLAPTLAGDDAARVAQAVLTDRHVTADAVEAAFAFRTPGELGLLERTLAGNVGARATGLTDGVSTRGGLDKASREDWARLAALHAGVDPARPGRRPGLRPGSELTVEQMGNTNLARLVGLARSATVDQLLADTAAVLAAAGQWRSAVRYGWAAGQREARDAPLDVVADTVILRTFGPARPVVQPDGPAKFLTVPGWQASRKWTWGGARLTDLENATALLDTFAGADLDTWQLLVTLAAEWTGPLVLTDLVTALDGLTA